MIDGDTSFLGRCSKEVRMFHESIQIVKSRCTKFECDDGALLMKICEWYKLMLEAKKISSVDLKLRSGWWGESDKGVSAGKLKTEKFKGVIMTKSRIWHEVEDCFKNKAGIFVFLHKAVPYFRFVGNSRSILDSVEHLLKSSFDGQTSGCLTALLVTSLASSWHFYWLPTNDKNGQNCTRWLQNDIILLHDSIWPQGLNSTLEVNNNKDFQMLRQSCLRHNWPPQDPNTNESKSIDFLDLLKEHQFFLLAPHWIKNNLGAKCQREEIPFLGLSVEEIKLSSENLEASKQENLEDMLSGSSNGSSITTTTIRTTIELNELERNRYDLMAKLNRDSKKMLYTESCVSHKVSRKTGSQQSRNASCNRDNKLKTN